MRRDSPVKRRNPSGEIVWVARCTGRDGKRHIAKPRWNRGKGTFKRKSEAQDAIDEAYGLSDRPDTLGAYFATWADRHPRSERTNATNSHRITLQVRRTAHEGQILEGTKTDRGEEDAGRAVPVPATLAWMLEAQINLNGPSCVLIFTTPRGRLSRERTFYRDVWKPAQEASGLDIRPHECRHSYVTHLRAASVNDADLAEIAGHRVETMLAHYAHPTGSSREEIRAAIG